MKKRILSLLMALALCLSLLPTAVLASAEKTLNVNISQVDCSEEYRITLTGTLEDGSEQVQLWWILTDESYISGKEYSLSEAVVGIGDINGDGTSYECISGTLTATDDANGLSTVVASVTVQVKPGTTATFNVNWTRPQYSDETGELVSVSADKCYAITPLTNDIYAWSDKICIVSGKVTIDTETWIGGESNPTKLVLLDNADLTINGQMKFNNSLIVYGGENGTGKMTVNAPDGADGEGIQFNAGNNGTDGKDAVIASSGTPTLTVYGGDVIVNGGAGGKGATGGNSTANAGPGGAGGKGGSGITIPTTVYGGSLTANGGKGGSGGDCGYAEGVTTEGGYGGAGGNGGDGISSTLAVYGGAVSVTGGKGGDGGKGGYIDTGVYKEYYTSGNGGNGGNGGSGAAAFNGGRLAATGGVGGATYTDGVTYTGTNGQTKTGMLNVTCNTLFVDADKSSYKVNGTDAEATLWSATPASDLNALYSFDVTLGEATTPLFDPCNGGEIIGAETPTDPSWTDHTFAGWYDAPIGGTEVKENYEVGKTYYAHWTNKAGKTVLPSRITVKDDGVYVGINQDKNITTGVKLENLSDYGLGFAAKTTDAYAKLTLSGAEIYSLDGKALYLDTSNAALTAEVTGDSILAAPSGADNLYGIYVPAYKSGGSEICFIGDGEHTLTVTAGNAAKGESCGMYLPSSVEANFDLSGTKSDKQVAKFVSEGGKTGSYGIKGTASTGRKPIYSAIVVVIRGDVEAAGGPSSDGVSAGLYGDIAIKSGIGNGTLYDTGTICLSTTGTGNNAYAGYSGSNDYNFINDGDHVSASGGNKVQAKTNYRVIGYKQSGTAPVKFGAEPFFYLSDGAFDYALRTLPTGDELAYPGHTKGYTFAGWYDQSVGGTQITDENGNFVAKWVPAAQGEDYGHYEPAESGEAITGFISPHYYYAHWKNASGNFVFPDELYIDANEFSSENEGTGRDAERMKAMLKDGAVPGFGIGYFYANDAGLFYNQVMTAEEWAAYGISFTPASQTASAKLTLNNASISGSIEVSYDNVPEPLTIELKGTNVVNDGYALYESSKEAREKSIANQNGIICGDLWSDRSDLTFIGDSNPSLTIYGYEDVIVAKSVTFAEGFNGVVDMTTLDDTCILAMGDGDYEGGDIIINGGTFTGRTCAEESEDGAATLFSANGDITITGGSITGKYYEYWGVISADTLTLGTASNPAKIINGAYYDDDVLKPITETTLEDNKVPGGVLNALEGQTLTISFKDPVTVTGVSMNAGSYTYGGSAVGYTGTPSAKNQAEETVNISEWTYTYYDAAGTKLANAPTNVGSYKLVVEAVDSNYEGKQTIEFTIAPKEVTVTVSDVEDQEFTGEQLTPSVTVTPPTGITLIRDTDYTVSYGDNINAGTNAGSVTVAAKTGSNYTFTSVTKNFDITPKSAAVTWTKAGSYTYTGLEQAVPTASYQSVSGTANCTVTENASKTFKDAGTYNFTAAAEDGNYTLTGNTLEVTIGQVTLTPTVASVTGKGYDGTTDAEGTISLAGAVNSESPTASGTFTWTDAAVGTNKVNVANIVLGSDYTTNYTLAVTKLENVTAPNSAAITKAATPPSGTPTSYTASVTSATSASLSDMGIVLAGAKIKSIAPEIAQTTYVITGVPTVAQDKLSISWTAQGTPSATNSDVYTLTVESTNYADFNVTVTFAGKTTVTFDPAAAPVNGGNAITFSDSGTTYEVTDPTVSVDGTALDPQPTMTYTYYESDGTGGWTPLTPADVKPTNAGSYKVVIAVPDSNATYTGSKEYEFTIAKATQTAPAANTGFSIDYEAETLTANDTYEVSSSNQVLTPLTNGDAVTPGGTYYVRLKGDDNHEPSPWTEISVPDRPALSGVTAKQETIQKRDDSYLRGVTEDMQYCVSTDGGAMFGGWQDGYGGSISFPLSTLSSDQYYVVKVRTKATNSSFAGEETIYTFTRSTQLVTVKMGEVSVQVDADTPVEKKTPTRDGYTFGGWYIDEELQYPWNFGDTMSDAMLNMLSNEFNNLTDNYVVTLYPKWIEIETPNTVVKGTVTEGTTPVPGACVELYLGTTKVATTTTNQNGEYAFDHVENGTYNIVVTKADGKTKTAMVTVDTITTFTMNVELPVSNVSSVLEYSGFAVEDTKSDISKTIVGGLDEIAKNTTVSGTDKVTIKLTVEPKEDEGTPAQEEIKREAGNGKKVEFLDMSLWEQVNNNDATDIGGGNTQLLTIVIPFDFTGVDVSSVMIIRKHGAGPATKLTTTANEDGEYFTVDRQAGTITLYAMKFSEYAIAYKERSSGGGSGSSGYAVTASSTKNGSISVDKKNAPAGSTVTVTVTPDKGFTLETLTVLDKNGKEVEVKNLGNGKYSFTMPSGKVSISATFMEDNTMLNFFVDVKATDYFYDAVLWAAENGITNGTDAVHFSPKVPVTRAQVVTFLWRTAGCPEPTGDASKFTDVFAEKYYAKAVAWAIEQGITKGTSETEFSPNVVCTRGQIVTFLARFAGVEDTDTASAFSDVKSTDYFAAAVKWAKDNNVTNGVTETTFEPYTNCNRAQVVTFLYRYIGK